MREVIIDGVRYVPEARAYDLEPGYLSPHFRDTEFCCNHCGSMEGHKVPEDLLTVLEDLRAHFAGAPITITSGYRCSRHNSNVGSNETSQHRYPEPHGQRGAADVQVRDVAPHRVYTYLDSLYGNSYGIGRYDSFTHIDMRPTKARW